MSEVIKQDLKTEALKLALEALNILLTEPIAHKAADKAEYLLLQAAPSIREVLADSALDRMAENARELGLDYEPAQKQLTDEKGRPLKFWGGKAEQPAQDQGQSCYCPNCEALSKELAALKAQQQQEPVAWMKDCADFWEHYTYISEASQENYKAEAQMWVEKLRTSPQPAQPSKPWVGLTDEEKAEIKKQANYNWETTASEYASKVQALTEAKLREKNT